MKNSLLFFCLPILLAFASPSSSKKSLQEDKSKLMVVVASETNRVLSGGKYQAKVYLYSVPESNPVFNVMGRELSVDADKSGKLAFTVTPGPYDNNGICKKSYRGSVSILLNGKDTLINFEDEYLVVKPIIKAEGSAFNMLYKNCGNELLIEVPEMGDRYNPSFRVDGGTIIPGVQKGKVTIIPSAAQVNLFIATNGNLLGSKNFNVLSIPDPKLKLCVDTIPLSVESGIQTSQLKSLTIKVSPEETFRKNFPKDARYRIVEAKCSLVRLNESFETINVVSEKADLSSWEPIIKKGDLLKVEVRKIVRTNFLNKQEEVQVDDRVFLIPIFN